MLKEDRVYPFGVDPAWKGAPNELEFYNSFKMKLSILLGVIQMSVGIVFSFLNYLQEKQPIKWINILFQFIPQLIFLWSIFGYMCILILIKWTTDWETLKLSPPFILPIIVQMFLSPGKAPPSPVFFNGQHGLQIFLLLLALSTPFLMLFPKPYLLKHYHNKNKHRLIEEPEGEGEQEQAQSTSHGHGDQGHGGHGEFEFGEVMIHQIIHTIEFVLGCISNTASYLRLWALSLAHSELSTVFWNRVLMDFIITGNPFYVFIGWAVWAGATFAVLLTMEVLSAFLHALRLHWVEFQNKFYVGDGIRFVPFSYKKILSGEEDEG